MSWYDATDDPTKGETPVARTKAVVPPRDELAVRVTELREADSTPKLLRHWRMLLGVSSAALCRELGLNTAQYTTAEQGWERVYTNKAGEVTGSTFLKDPDTALMIASRLGVDTHALIVDPEDELARTHFGEYLVREYVKRHGVDVGNDERLVVNLNEKFRSEFDRACVELALALTPRFVAGIRTEQRTPGGRPTTFFFVPKEVLA